ncbi:MAG: EamA family transporter, partial [Pseudomonadota bacterium]
LLAASVPVTAIALALEPWPNWTALSPAAIFALVYVLALPMTFGQWAYFSIVGRFPATVAALGTLAIPVVGVVSSAWMLGETIGLRDIVALTLICAALCVVLIVPHIRRARS